VEVSARPTEAEAVVVATVALPPVAVAEAVEVGVEAEEARRAAAVVVVAKTTLGDNPWYGGRDGHVVYEDDWVTDRSWTYHKRLLPICDHGGDPNRWWCPSCEKSFTVYLKLFIAGTSKGRCVPISATARLGFHHERSESIEVSLGQTSVDSLRKAKTWASKLVSMAAIKVLLQTYYQTFELVSSKKGRLIEAKVDGVWVEWLWTFEQYPDWVELLSQVRDNCLRVRSRHNSGWELIKGFYGGYSSAFWPSFWDRIVNRGGHWSSRNTDEYGPL